MVTCVLQVVGLLMGLAYFNTQNDQRAAQNKSGALFNIIVYFTFGNVAIQTMVRIVMVTCCHGDVMVTCCHGAVLSW